MTRLFWPTAALLAAVAGPLPAQTGQGVVHGRISDSAGSPIVGATVRITSKPGTFESSTTSDSGGNYRFTSVPAGDSLVVVARRIGYQLARQYLYLSPGDTVRVDLELMPAVFQLDTVATRSAGPGDPVITRTEILNAKVRDVWQALMNLRPKLLVEMCGPSVRDPWAMAGGNESCPVGSPFEQGTGPGRLWGKALMTNACPRIEKIFIDSVRVTFAADPNEPGVAQVLKGLNPDEIERVEFVDCWRYDRPVYQRNALWVRTRPRADRDATRWLSLHVSYGSQLQPLDLVQGNEILFKNMISVAVGYEFRIGQRMLGRVSAGTTLGAERTVRDPSDCVGCFYNEYSGGAVMTAGFDVIRRVWKTSLSVGAGLGVRRYQFPSPANDACALCVSGGIGSENSLYFRPFLRYSMGRGDVSFLEIGPFLGRYHRRLMVDVSLALGANLPLKRVPIRRPSQLPVETSR